MSTAIAQVADLTSLLALIWWPKYQFGMLNGANFLKIFLMADVFGWKVTRPRDPAKGPRGTKAAQDPK